MLMTGSGNLMSFDFYLYVVSVVFICIFCWFGFDINSVRHKIL